MPIGLFFGRLANFINDELWGRITDVPWAMIFPTGGPFPRHPSQLYEAGLEGLVLFVLLRVLTHRFRTLKKTALHLRRLHRRLRAAAASLRSSSVNRIRNWAISTAAG